MAWSPLSSRVAPGSARQIASSRAMRSLALEAAIMRLLSGRRGFPQHRLPLVVQFDRAEWPVMVMRKKNQPLLRNRLCIEAFTLLNAGHRVEIVTHDPSGIEMRAGGDQVGDVAGMPPRRLDVNPHQLRRVTREALDRDTRDDLLDLPGPLGWVKIEERHLAALDQRVVVVADVADGIALQLQMAVLHLAAMREVARVGEGGHHATLWRKRRVPAAVVEMQVRVDDDVDLFRTNAGRGKGMRQLFLCPINLAELRRKLVADPGLDGDGVLSRPHDDRVQPQQDSVLGISWRALLPQRLGHHAEHGAPVEQIPSVAQDG